MTVKFKWVLLFSVFLILAAFLPEAHALGAGDYGFVAYSSPTTVFREVRVSATPTSTETIPYRGGGVTVYYGSYARTKVNEWLGSGKTVYLVRVSSDNKYNGIAQIKAGWDD
ncbi:MAG: hypothetical protein AB2L14_02515 [Candidatus Xenobiia bacterium LiM19]